MSYQYHRRLKFHRRPLLLEIASALRDWLVRIAETIADGIQCKR